ncbi:hypothetical protein ABZS88_40335 [Streptomyces sp. NPDC005480]|uniref:hypothetical protein n=1 Tax=Streptomyces sp. NPDC005480 TaxID=3154880 RepID=UPI0033BD3945
MRVVRECIDVRLGLQQVGQARAAGQRPHGLAAFAQRTDQRAGDFADDRADRAGRQQRLGDVGERGLHLLWQHLAEPASQAAAAQVLLQRLAGMHLFPVAAQRDVEGGQRPAELREGEPQREQDLLGIGAGRAGQVDAHRNDPHSGPGGLAPLLGPARPAERGLDLP